MFKRINRTQKMFGIFVIGGLGLMGVRQQSKSKMQHPLVYEALEILRHEKQIKELVGYPIDIRNRFNQKSDISRDTNDNEVGYFEFYVKGPRGEVIVVLSGSSVLLQSVDQTSLLDSYYIPDKNVLGILDQQILKPNEQQRLDKDNKVWKIDYMYADIGPSLRITLQQQDNKQDDKKQNNNNNNNKSNSNNDMEMIQYLLKKKMSYQIKNLMRSDIMEMSDTELEETRKMRLNQMYQSAGVSRLLLFGAVFVGGMGYYLFVKMNKKQSIAKSIIHQNAIQIIKNNNQIRTHLGQQRSLVFGQNIRGQQINEKGRFEFDVLSPKGKGVAYVDGTFNDESGDWMINSLVFQLQKGDKTEDIKII